VRRADPVALARELGDPRGLVVVLDFDGTLSPIVNLPDDAAPAPGAIDALRALASTTKVAILSGRDVDDLRSRLPVLDVVLIGGHGAQIVEPDGSSDELVDVAALARVLDPAEQELEELVGAEPGWLVERKPTSLAVHHRLVPAEVEEQILPRVRALLDRHVVTPPGFDVLEGKSVLELRPRGADKGRALERLLRRHPGRRALVIGDDITDEDAFAVAVANGGCAVLVDPIGRASKATDRLDDPSEVVTLLAHLAGLEG
jgi:trehalose 6-phosphate phosphatase